MYNPWNGSRSLYFYFFCVPSSPLSVLLDLTDISGNTGSHFLYVKYTSVSWESVGPQPIILLRVKCQLLWLRVSSIKSTDSNVSILFILSPTVGPIKPTLQTREPVRRHNTLFQNTLSSWSSVLRYPSSTVFPVSIVKKNPSNPVEEILLRTR